MTEPKINFYQNMLGMDTEMFVSQNNHIIGAERFIDTLSDRETSEYYYGKFVKDGVQLEINTKPTNCRQIMASALESCFKILKTQLSSRNMDIDFKSHGEINQIEFDSLGEDSKIFGCNPDYRVYKSLTIPNDKPEGEQNKIRTCGGHIHFGSSKQVHIVPKEPESSKCIDCDTNLNCMYRNMPSKQKEIPIGTIECFNNLGYSIHDLNKSKIIDTLLKKLNFKYTYKDINIIYPPEYETLIHPEMLIPIMDILVGIPSILLDRDEYAATRRKQYGRAGDFRYQPHGIEYRTLSNFWIHNYPLMSLITGLARLAFLIVDNDLKYGTKYTKKLINLAGNVEEIQEAINTNNYKIARDIWLKIEDFIIDISPVTEFKENSPITKKTIHAFKQFIIKGYKHYFPHTDIIQYWAEDHDHSEGWERFAWSMNIDNNITKTFALTEIGYR